MLPSLVGWGLVPRRSTPRRAQAIFVLPLAALCCRHDPRGVVGRTQDLLLAFPGAEAEVRGETFGKPVSDYVHVQQITAGGVSAAAIFVHPPGAVTFEIDVLEGGVLESAVGIDDAAAEKSDGVEFLVEVTVDGAVRTVLAQRVDPRRPEMRRWSPIACSLAPYGGRRVALTLRTLPGGDPGSDWGGFAVPQVRSRGRMGRLPTFASGSMVLLSLDTLRVDRIGGFGDPDELSPCLDRALRSCRWYPGAVSPSHWTLPAHASLFSSTYPDVHRVAPERALSPSLPTLPERLKAAGYRTAGFVADVTWLKPEYGFGRGFDFYMATAEPSASRTRRIRDYLETADSRPLFLFVHFFDAHSDFGALPYEASPEELWRCAPDARSSPRCAGYRCASEELYARNQRGDRLTLVEEEAMRQTYGAGVADLDHEVARLCGELEGVGLLRSALLAIMSDHGEEFGDHGLYLHEQMYGEVMRGLLALRPPRTRGAIFRGGASLVDLAPTLLAFARGVPPAAWQGRDLLSGAPRDVTYARGNKARVAMDVHAAVLDDGDGHLYAYDLDRDPGQREPLPGDWGSPLGRALADQRAVDEKRARAVEEGSAMVMSPEERERLRSLGYADPGGSE